MRFTFPRLESLEVSVRIGWILGAKDRNRMQGLGRNEMVNVNMLLSKLLAEVSSN